LGFLDHSQFCQQHHLEEPAGAAAHIAFEERRVGEGRRNLQSRKREAYNRKRVQGRKRMGGRIRTIRISSSRR